jgi:hypothetical protein
MNNIKTLNIKNVFQAVQAHIDALEQQRKEYESRGILYNLADGFCIVEADGLQWKMYKSGKTEFQAKGGLWLPCPGTPHPDVLEDLKWRVFFFENRARLFALALAVGACFVWYHVLLLSEYKGMAIKMQTIPAYLMTATFCIITGGTLFALLSAFSGGFKRKVDDGLVMLLGSGSVIPADILSGDGWLIQVSASADEQPHQFVRRHTATTLADNTLILSVQFRADKISIAYTGDSEHAAVQTEVCRHDKELGIDIRPQAWTKETWENYVDYVFAIGEAMPTIIKNINFQ